jgi:hypothetical protein
VRKFLEIVAEIIQGTAGHKQGLVVVALVQVVLE